MKPGLGLLGAGAQLGGGRHGAVRALVRQVHGGVAHHVDLRGQRRDRVDLAVLLDERRVERFWNDVSAAGTAAGDETGTLLAGLEIGAELLDANRLGAGEDGRARDARRVGGPAVHLHLALTSLARDRLVFGNRATGAAGLALELAQLVGSDRDDGDLAVLEVRLHGTDARGSFVGLHLDHNSKSIGLTTIGSTPASRPWPPSRLGDPPSGDPAASG